MTNGKFVVHKQVITWPANPLWSDSWEGPELRPVINPFGRGLCNGLDLGQVLADDPARGEMLLDELVQQTRDAIGTAVGQDGILYLLYGARGLHTTPMEYGGHYLERDREILTEFMEGRDADTTPLIVFVVGEDDAYLDFVSDLPADVFAWDAKSTGVTVEQMRHMRQGKLASNDPDADIELRMPESVVADLELQVQQTHAATV